MASDRRKNQQQLKNMWKSHFLIYLQTNTPKAMHIACWIQEICVSMRKTMNAIARTLSYMYLYLCKRQMLWAKTEYATKEEENERTKRVEKKNTHTHNHRRIRSIFISLISVHGNLAAKPTFTYSTKYKQPNELHKHYPQLNKSPNKGCDDAYAYHTLITFDETTPNTMNMLRFTFYT